MIFKLKVECVSGAYYEEKCIRVLAMDGRSSLCDLHKLIQNAVSFGNDHLYAFFVANSASPFGRRDWISDEDEHEDRVEVFATTRLDSIWPLEPRKKLYYLFDFGDDWIFEITKLRPSKSDASLSVPSVIERTGPDPKQYPVWDEE